MSESIDNAINHEKANTTLQASLGPNEWRAHCLAWKKSSMSKAQFCKTRDLNVDNFYYWCRRWLPKEVESTSRH